MLEIHLPVADTTVFAPWVVLLGASVGFLSGLFGVGGGFILTPMLNILFGIPYNVAAGSDLAQMLGTSVSATSRHRGFGHVDVRLGLCMLAGAWLGTELGARVVEFLKTVGRITVAGRELDCLDLFIPLAFLVLLSVIGTVVLRESLRARKRPPRGGAVETPIIKWVQGIRLPPMISLRTSGIRISIWILIGIGFATGFLAGFMGIGGGFVLMPTLIYVIGVPTTMAIGTGLFYIMFVAAFGSYTHALKGNVDLVLAVLLLLGSIFGAQVGAWLTEKVRGAKIRYWFSLAVFVSAIAVLAKLVVQLGVLGSPGS